MRTRKALAIVAGLSAAVLTGCGGGSNNEDTVVSYSADYPSYASAEDLTQSADLVVRVTVLDSHVEELLPEVSDVDDPARNPQAGLANQPDDSTMAVVVTVSTVRVTDVLKGDAQPGDLLSVSQLGGEFEGVQYIEEQTTLLTELEPSDCVLMLADHGQGEPFDLLNPSQAMYHVTSDQALQPVAGGTDDSTTLEDLRALATDTEN